MDTLAPSDDEKVPEMDKNGLDSDKNDPEHETNGLDADPKMDKNGQEVVEESVKDSNMDSNMDSVGDSVGDSVDVFGENRNMGGIQYPEYRPVLPTSRTLTHIFPEKGYKMDRNGILTHCAVGQGSPNPNR